MQLGCEFPELISVVLTNQSFPSVDPVQRGDFDNAILEPLYASVHDPVPLAHFEPHRLSVFFIVIGVGALFDPHTSARIVAEQYHAFACAAFSLESIVDGATSASIQALFMMAHFLLITDRSGSERRWLIIGLTSKVIHMVSWPYRYLPTKKSGRRSSFFSVRIA
jgi:hypothetical protein